MIGDRFRISRIQRLAVLFVLGLLTGSAAFMAGCYTQVKHTAPTAEVDRPPRRHYPRAPGDTLSGHPPVWREPGDEPPGAAHGASMHASCDIMPEPEVTGQDLKLHIGQPGGYRDLSILVQKITDGRELLVDPQSRPGDRSRWGTPNSPHLEGTGVSIDLVVCVLGYGARSVTLGWPPGAAYGSPEAVIGDYVLRYVDLTPIRVHRHHDGAPYIDDIDGPIPDDAYVVSLFVRRSDEPDEPPPGGR